MKKKIDLYMHVCFLCSHSVLVNEALDVAPDGRLSLDEVFQDPDLTKALFQYLL